MSKTRNAFAFRNFDAEKILQRPYFKDFGFNEELTDAEILQTLNVTDSDSVDDAEKKLSTIKALHERGKKFNNLIMRHIARHEKIRRQIEFEGTKLLTPIEYVDAVLEVNRLLKKLQAQYYEVEEIIQARYRKIFTDNLRKYRKAAGLTQKELGELVQVSPMGMSHYARSERDMPTHTLIRIAKVLNVSADKLLGLT